jgi:superfamily II DNA/RNA helicase
MNFEGFNLSKETTKSISEIGFEEPTAFGIPIVEKCQNGRNPFAIVMEPTRGVHKICLLCLFN